ncbi:hypothetical protein F5148DRAFT_1147759 [Russula earlei]|uniref:Uncharacterized protein n=1 Tax=Russula earlei TaxID=71964 RepID=A0ACC0UEW8_9AGAM|nr:hypothetical protein F5148DRAFT_1147759 [Russula earlei]
MSSAIPAKESIFWSALEAFLRNPGVPPRAEMEQRHRWGPTTTKKFGLAVPFATIVCLGSLGVSSHGNQVSNIGEHSNTGTKVASPEGGRMDMVVLNGTTAKARVVLELHTSWITKSDGSVSHVNMIERAYGFVCPPLC